MNTNEFKFYCFYCEQPLKCDPCHAGRQIQCPACNHLIHIPNPPPGAGFTHVQPESGQTWATHVPRRIQIISSVEGTRGMGCKSIWYCHTTIHWRC